MVRTTGEGVSPGFFSSVKILLLKSRVSADGAHAFARVLLIQSQEGSVTTGGQSVGGGRERSARPAVRRMHFLKACLLGGRSSQCYLKNKRIIHNVASQIPDFTHGLEFPCL